MESYWTNLKTFKSHSEATERFQKLLAAQPTSVSTIQKKLSAEGKETPQAEFRNLKSMADGWLKEFGQLKDGIVEANIIGHVEHLDMI